MTAYAADSRDRVFDAIDMLSLIERHGVQLRRAGADSYFGNCPFHDERTASFHVSPDKKMYHCFGCQAQGDAFKFVMETEGVDFVGALQSLAAQFGVTLETRDERPEAAAQRRELDRLTGLLDRTATYYARLLWESAEAADARSYLLGRGLSEEVLRRFRVGYSPRAWDRVLVASRKAGFSDAELLEVGLVQRSQRSGNVFDRFRGQIMFPTADERGRVRGFGARRLGQELRADGSPLPKYVNTADGRLYHKREVLYGIDLARRPAAKAGRMILVEGYTDVLALHQAGISNAVGVMGTSLTAEGVRTLERIAGVVVLCLDADDAGRQAILRAAEAAAGRLELRVVALPEGSDPADLVVSEGADALRERLGRSVPFVEFEVDRILASAEVDSAEGRDRALSEIAPVLAGLGPSALRDELMRRVSGALELAPARLTAALSGANGERVADADHDRSPGLARPLAAAPKSEQVFLALCLALPDDGERQLSEPDVVELLTSERLRRAATHLRGRTRTPTEGIPTGDEQLDQTVRDLQRRAGELAARQEGRPELSADRLEHARLVLELERIDRARIKARAQGAPITPLARERERVRAELHAVVARIEKTV